MRCRQAGPGWGDPRVRRGRRVAFEVLEDRRLPATFLVLNTADDGPDSLRQAILDANALAGRDRIEFQIPGEGPHTIAPISPLEITDPVTIDGYTQTGSRRNTQPATLGGSDAILAIELNGDGAPAGVDGLLIRAGSSTVRGLAINGFRGAGIRLADRGGNSIEGNFIGTDILGMDRVANERNGVSVDTSDNTIGGAAPDAVNVISGNTGNGVRVGAPGGDPSRNLIQGNIIGLDRRETLVLGNSANGLTIIESSDNTVAANVVAGNQSAGIIVFGLFFDQIPDDPPRGTRNIIRGNLVGTNPSGARLLSNRSNGITINQASLNTIGGTMAADRNVISGNEQSGVSLEGNMAHSNVVLGNYIGTDPTGLRTLDNNGDGVSIVNSARNTIGGTTPGARNVIGRNQIGVSIQTFTDEEIVAEFGAGSSDRNVVQGNFIGTTKEGDAVLDNAQEGVLIVRARDNTIGGSVPRAGNLISGNLIHGIRIAGSDAEERGRTPPVDIPATGNVVQGNLIGTDASGTSITGRDGMSLGNRQVGVVLIDAVNNTIGGTTREARNIIAGNGNAGIQITGLVREGNLALGNFIGTNASGTGPLGNGGDGVLIDADTTQAASGNTIGGITAEARNVIAANRGSGIALSRGTVGNLIQGNFTGLAFDGTSPLGNNVAGVFLSLAAHRNTIGGAVPGAGNVIARNSIGILINGAGTGRTLIQGNFIGTDASGTRVIASDNRPLGNAAFGILLLDGASDNTIGGTTAGARNIVSGNGNGVSIAGSLSRNNTVRGNFIGTDTTGSVRLGNLQAGVFVNNAPENTIGGDQPGAGNLVAGNLGPGISLFGGDARHNAIQGNSIGTNRDGTAPLGNFLDGVLLDSATDNSIGGTVANTGNLISGNGMSGVQVFGPGARRNALLGNRIGTDAAGAAAVANASSGVFLNGAPENTVGGTSPAARNVIAGNGQDGIRVFGLGEASGPIQGNYIGTDATGRGALGNGRAGILIERAAGDLATTPGVTIGGTAAGSGNVISANATAGIAIGRDAPRGNAVVGNFIGTDADGARPLGNALGVSIEDVPGNTIGSTTPAAFNLIAGNRTIGILILGASATGNRIVGNRIGTDRDGARLIDPLQPQIRQDQGVLISNAPRNTIGGTTADERNILSGNMAGVEVAGPAATDNWIVGNFIGTDRTGTAAVGNNFGVLIRGASRTTIGGADADDGAVDDIVRSRNVISGNDLDDGVQVAPQDTDRRLTRDPQPEALSVGVFLLGPNARDNLVRGNLIGLADDGMTPLGNANGIFLQGASGNRVLENTISANRSVGVYILGPGADSNRIQDNRIGTDLRRRRTPRLGNIRYGLLLVNAPRQNAPGPRLVRLNLVRGSRIANFREFSDTAPTRTGQTTPS